MAKEELKLEIELELELGTNVFFLHEMHVHPLWKFLGFHARTSAPKNKVGRGAPSNKNR